MMPFFNESFGNPSSVYKLGQENKKAVEIAKERIAKAIGASANEIYFVHTATKQIFLECVSESARIFLIGYLNDGHYI